MTKIISFSISVFCLATLVVKAQELPPIKNFSPENYWAANQNWMISQSENKHIFVANTAGLLEYNGSKWSFPKPNSSEMRSVKVIDDLIFTGSYMDFGYWTRDNHGTLNYNSLVDKLNIKLIRDEAFWKIEEFQGRILFQSLDRIYIYNPQDVSYSIIEAKNKTPGIFITSNNLFFQKKNEGIYTIDNGEELLFSDDQIFRINALVGVFTLNERTVFLSEEGKFYILHNDSIVRWYTEAENDLISEEIYSSVQLKDESLVLGTISNGIIHIDKFGKVLTRINKAKGLNNNTVLSIFEDQDNNLWLGLDNGISLINLKSHFKFFTDFKGNLGLVYTASEFENKFYIGTNQGLFYRPNTSKSEFKLVPGTQGQVWYLEEIYGELFCGHNKGTYLIRDGKAIKISDLPGTWKIEKIKNNKQLLLQGNYNGLSILEKNNGLWKLRNVIKGFDLSSRFFEFTEENEILLNHEHEGIFTLKFDSVFSKVIITKQESAHGYGTSLTAFNNHIYYSSNFTSKVLKYDLEQKEFFLDTLMTQEYYSEYNKIIGILISSPNTNTLWGLSNNNIISVSPGKFKNSLETKEFAISGTFRRSLGVVGFENVTFLRDEKFLIGASNGYAILDVKKTKEREFNVKINTIYKNSHKPSKETIDLEGNSILKSNENYLEFLYSVPEFDSTADVKFQYNLEGANNEWSLWTNDSSVSFYNLKPGSYTFKVRARIGNEDSENIETFEFEIEQPWYFSNIAWFGYALLVILFSIIIHRSYKYYWTKKHRRDMLKKKRELKMEKLKNERELITIRNNALRQNIESKNNELAQTTMMLIKKNEFLSSLKGELKKVEGEANLKYIFKIIDKNLKNVDDWKLFEEAFNNADKEFFKKLKLKHPNLTPNDLKLCAYLRMNLSSKEIAPILNISAKSVDIKRYRLRKKMKLEHNVSLSNYIFEV